MQVFLTGVPGLNENGGVGEMLRLNTAIAPDSARAQSNLGVLGGDVAGYPNGRRPGDDVVDISLRVVMGVLLPTADAPDGQLPYTDGAYVDASFFEPAFPYLQRPAPGLPPTVDRSFPPRGRRASARPAAASPTPGARAVRLPTTLLCTALALAALCGAARAHEFSLRPASFEPEPGSVLAVSLRVGHGAAAEPVPRDEARIARFVFVGGEGEKPVVGFDGAVPAGLVRPERAGVAVLGYRSLPSPLELPAPRFEAYLRDEGLEAVAALRRERGETAEPGRERFARSSKALLRVGGADGAGWDRRLGLPLELTPLRDPFELREGPSGALEPLELELSWEGRPLCGALVRASPLDDEVGLRLEARTDERGRASFALPFGGQWLFNAVHMERSEVDGAQWASTWGSLTLELCDSAAPAVAVTDRGASR